MCDYQRFYEFYFNNRKIHNFILIKDYQDTYEFDNKTLESIQKYNKYLSLYHENGTTAVEKDILIPKIYDNIRNIERYCNHECMNYIRFGSSRRKRKCDEIRKQIEKLII